MSGKRAIACLLVGAMLFSLLTVAGCAGKTDGADPRASIKAIQAKRKIVIGTSSGYYPFEMVNADGKLIGFDIDLGAKIGTELGVAVEWKDLADFNGLIPALESGQLDIVIAGMSIMADRALRVDFTTSYFRTGQAVAVSRSVKDVASWRDLDKEGMVIAVATGTTSEVASRRLFKKATVRALDGSILAGLEVLSGNAQAMVADLDWVTIFAGDNADRVYGILEPFTVEDLGIAVRPGQRDLVDWLDALLTEFVGNEEYEAMYDYYFRYMRWKDEMPPG